MKQPIVCSWDKTYREIQLKFYKDMAISVLSYDSELYTLTIKQEIII